MSIGTLIYFGCDGLGVIAAIFYSLYALPRYGVSRTRGLVLMLCVYAATYAWMLALYWICTGFMGGQNYIRSFVFAPAIILLFAALLDVDWRIGFDLAAPIMCISMFTGKLGCMYAGCCASWIPGFPQQLLEGATALFIAAWLIWRIDKNGYKADGTSMWWMLLFFGLTRFCWEFLRDNDKLFCGISELALWALAAAALGGIALLVIKLRKSYKADAR